MQWSQLPRYICESTILLYLWVNYITMYPLEYKHVWLTHSMVHMTADSVESAASLYIWVNNNSMYSSEYKYVLIWVQMI